MINSLSHRSVNFSDSHSVDSRLFSAVSILDGLSSISFPWKIRTNKHDLPVIIVPAVKFRIPDEAGVMQTIAARAALHAPFVI